MAQVEHQTTESRKLCFKVLAFNYSVPQLIYPNRKKKSIYLIGKAILNYS